jgi:putative membrane-bound dehydrogenase-like protein
MLQLLMGLAACGLVFASSSAAASVPLADEGVLPMKDGRPLNFDFETGDLRDWTVEGEAFLKQPIEGDVVVKRRSDNKSNHQGKYWIGGFERFGDKPKGKLISTPFQVTHPWASFLVAGGTYIDTCVEIVDAQWNEVLFRASGLEEENLKRVAVDLTRHQGKMILIRISDQQTGHWGHVNFDDFRFHSTKPKVDKRPQQVLTADNYPNAGMKPEESAKAMTVPEGFNVTLFAGEPDVRQPIAFCQDDRGRLWVAEAYCYPRRQKPGEERDRILIFEDTNGDGKFDKRTVFMEKLNLVSGLEYGFGGLWVGAAPHLLYIPIDASGDKPAGPPKIILDGWGYQDTHETLNTFCWGPDGWLYGCHGVFTHSKVGAPNTPDAQRTKINAGIWRLHPQKHTFEVFAEGTSNPWGLDYNKDGQFFIEACVIPHCFHIIQGARYQRQAGSHFNPYTYADIGTIADHFHYLGANPHGGNNKSDAAGGGHAHCGLMVYEGGTWPKEYHGQLFMGNIHGRRINMDRLTRRGSGYVASHGPDFLLANDAWARFINLQYGPDGNVYLIDWYDQQACHRNEPEIWDRTNGRIYKISHRSTQGKETDLKKLGGDLSKLDVGQLNKLLTHENQWYVRHARRVLMEKQSQTAMGKSQVIIPVNLERNQTITANSKLPEYVQAWQIQLACEDKSADANLVDQLTQQARGETTPVTRLYLASALQRIPADKRWDILAALLKHGEDKTDHNLPLMYWYAAEPLAELDMARALHLAVNAEVPILGFMVRRIGAMERSDAIETVVATLARTEKPEQQRIIMAGLATTLKGRRDVVAPPSWTKAQAALLLSKDENVMQEALQLGVTFHNPEALQEMMRRAQATTETVAIRQGSLRTLIQSKEKPVGPLLLKLLDDVALRGEVIRGLAAFDQAETAAAILKHLPTLNSTERREAVATLSSRVAWAKELLNAVSDKRLPMADVPADVVRQLRQLNDTALNEQITTVWGVVRNSPADRLKQIASMKKQITAGYQEPVDLALGRALYQKTCAQCHQLFGTGGKVGPDITGSNRANLDYLLENIYDPNAVIPKEYAATFFVTKDGRSITGIVKERNAKTVTVMTATETLTLALDDIDGEKPSDVSMMPEDQMKPFSLLEIRSLISYLQSPVQTPLAATQDNAASFFNGKDLTGWVGDTKLWKVENGEIVGTSPGIKKNEFLKSEMQVGDFRLTLKVKLMPNKENSGIQFRSEAQAGGDVKGYQADIGQGWWGKLYEEHGRALLTKNDGDQFVKKDDWNEYVIEARGSVIKTFINGNACVNLDDPKGAKKGIIAFQIHSGGPMEVRFKDVKLEVLK